MLTAGESHGPLVLTILEGMPAGLPLSPDDINPDPLAARTQRCRQAAPRRQPAHEARTRHGRDRQRCDGRFIGAPIGVQVRTSITGAGKLSRP
jgi:chorismate synthase